MLTTRMVADVAAGHCHGWLLLSVSCQEKEGRPVAEWELQEKVIPAERVGTAQSAEGGLPLHDRCADGPAAAVPPSWWWWCVGVQVCRYQVVRDKRVEIFYNFGQAPTLHPPTAPAPLPPS